MSETVKKEFIIENIDSILGTPSAQRILRLLFCWGQLPASQLIKKSKLSESQVYNTLKNLESINIVETSSRGIYTYTKHDFSIKLKEAYLSQLIQLIGQSLHDLSSNLDKKSFNELDTEFTSLVTLWEPILDTHYPLKASSISGHILERIS